MGSEEKRIRNDFFAFYTQYSIMSAKVAPDGLKRCTACPTFPGPDLDYRLGSL